MFHFERDENGHCCNFLKSRNTENPPASLLLGTLVQATYQQSADLQTKKQNIFTLTYNHDLKLVSAASAQLSSAPPTDGSSHLKTSKQEEVSRVPPLPLTHPGSLVLLLKGSVPRECCTCRPPATSAFSFQGSFKRIPDPAMSLRQLISFQL